MLKYFILTLFSLCLTGCAETGQIGASDSDSSETNSSLYRGIGPDAPSVHTVQLHAGQSETDLPVVEMGSGLQLRLAFDLLESPSRPVTVYFYHTDRFWEKDLFAAEYLTSFHQDDILDYRSSGSTQLPYVHYEYAFPNSSIDFKVSGNYILRVSEQGREDDVLFERRFFVTEQSTPVEMNLDQVMMAGNRATSIQPFIRFRPTNTPEGAFNYAVCFVRNAMLDSGRCTDRPTLDVQPDISFYLQPEDSFEPVSANFFVNLTEIGVGGRVERVNQQGSPWQLEIEPDYARFAGTQLAPFINGQTVIQAANRYVTEPDYQAEYIEAVFKFVPSDGVRVPGEIAITGSFSNWVYDSRNTLRWNELQSWYEIGILLKQGHYEYSYVSDNPDIARALNTGFPQLRNLYTVFVYFDDVFTRTDRLIAVQTVFVD